MVAVSWVWCRLGAPLLDDALVPCVVRLCRVAGGRRQEVVVDLLGGGLHQEEVVDLPLPWKVCGPALVWRS